MNPASTAPLSGLPRVLVHGASGRMGQALLRLAAGRDDLNVIAAVSQHARQACDGEVPQFSAAQLHDVPLFDVAVDFSLPSGFDDLLALCTTRGAALVSGTTGLDAAQRDAIKAASARIAVIWASNFSLGVAVLTNLVERAARALPGWDCDIVEQHHAGKRDAPSGTALALGEAAQHAGATPRYASLRAGDIVGEHTVQFAGHGERIELVHRAGNRDIFARGALLAASRLSGRAPGIYTLGNLLD